MNRCLITGMGGFLGSHLAEFLLAQGLAVYGTVHRDVRNIELLKHKLVHTTCDLLERDQVEATVATVRPNLVFHLASQSLVPRSWLDPEETLRVNVLGTLHLLEAIRRAGDHPLVIVAGSSAECGATSQRQIPITEDKPPCPASPYGVSKVAAGLLARLYWRAYGMKVVQVRPFFVIGPRKVGDVCSDFARGVVAVENGHSERLTVGNLAPIRDFLDVRDAVRAFWLLAESGSPGEVYNVCSGVGHTVREVLDIIVSLARRPVPVEEDPQRMRPADEPCIVGDNRKLRALGWAPELPLERTLADMLDYWRGQSD
jgi:GDP-4-dehydro-6-deoxy-D-mannose reductase